MKGYFFLKNTDLWDDVAARFPFGSWTAKMTRHGAEAPLGLKVSLIAFNSLGSRKILDPVTFSTLGLMEFESHDNLNQFGPRRSSCLGS